MSRMAAELAAMIPPEQVFLLVGPVDMRWGMQRLSLLVQQTLGRSPCDGLMIIKGVLERNKEISHIIAGEIVDASAAMVQLQSQSRDFH